MKLYRLADRKGKANAYAEGYCSHIVCRVVLDGEDTWEVWTVDGTQLGRFKYYAHACNALKTGDYSDPLLKRAQEDAA